MGSGGRNTLNVETTPTTSDELRDLQTPPTSPLSRAASYNSLSNFSADGLRVRNTWKRPDDFIARLPSECSVLEMWRLPAEVGDPTISEESHAALVAGIARKAADGAFEPGALATEAPMGWWEELVCIVALALFFLGPAFAPVAVFLALLSWALVGWVYFPSLALALVAALTIWAPAPRAGLKHNFVLRAMYRYFSFRVVFAPENKFVADRPYVWIATADLPGMQVLTTAPYSCVWIVTDDLPGMQVLSTAPYSCVWIATDDLPGMQVLSTAPPPYLRYIHVCAPHSLFPIGGLLWQLSPYLTSRCHGRAGVASVVTRLPIWRQVTRLP